MRKISRGQNEPWKNFALKTVKSIVDNKLYQYTQIQINPTDLMDYTNAPHVLINFIDITLAGADKFQQCDAFCASKKVSANSTSVII